MLLRRPSFNLKCLFIHCISAGGGGGGGGSTVIMVTNYRERSLPQLIFAVD